MANEKGADKAATGLGDETFSEIRDRIEGELRDKPSGTQFGVFHELLNQFKENPEISAAIWEARIKLGGVSKFLEEIQPDSELGIALAAKIGNEIKIQGHEIIDVIKWALTAPQIARVFLTRMIAIVTESGDIGKITEVLSILDCNSDEARMLALAIVKTCDIRTMYGALKEIQGKDSAAALSLAKGITKSPGFSASFVEMKDFLRYIPDMNSALAVTLANGIASKFTPDDILCLIASTDRSKLHANTKTWKTLMKKLREKCDAQKILYTLRNPGNLRIDAYLRAELCKILVKKGSIEQICKILIGYLYHYRPDEDEATKILAESLLKSNSISELADIIAGVEMQHYGDVVARELAKKIAASGDVEFMIRILPTLKKRGICVNIIAKDGIARAGISDQILTVFSILLESEDSVNSNVFARKLADTNDEKIIKRALQAVNNTPFGFDSRLAYDILNTALHTARISNAIKGLLDKANQPDEIAPGETTQESVVAGLAR